LRPQQKQAGLETSRAWGREGRTKARALAPALLGSRWAGVGAAGSLAGNSPRGFFIVLSRILRLRYKIFKGARRIRRSPPEMSLESLFQHILFTEHQAEESRRVLREVRAEIARCRGKIKKATEDLNEEKVKLESK
ncbi:hypothetical protein A6R68_09929, partial [Neotoma lepida]